MKPGDMPYNLLWEGVCWLHPTKWAYEARSEPLETILGGVLWLHLDGKGLTAEKRPLNPPGKGAECGFSAKNKQGYRKKGPK